MTYRLLALCARAVEDLACDQCVAREAAGVTAWEDIPAQAEAHGMAPLLYAHLQAAGIPLPLAVKRELQGLTLRHRHANRVRAQVLRDILAACALADIPVLALKGAALAHLVYPDPALRPMSDLDLLVRRSQLPQMQDLLADLGFRVSCGAVPAHRHLAAAGIEREGLPIWVELHHRLLSDYWDTVFHYLRGLLPGHGRYDSAISADLDSLLPASQSFDLAGLAVRTLGPVDMLHHLCRHLASHVNAWDFGRLIWVADIVRCAERFATQIDWEWVRGHIPDVLNTLSLLHVMTPLSDGLLCQAGIKTGRPVAGIGVEFQGWPRVRREDWRERGWRCVLRDTFLPSEWWLRLRYRLGSDGSLFWYRWVRHPLYILGHVMRAALERLGWPTFSELAGQRVSADLKG